MEFWEGNNKLNLNNDNMKMYIIIFLLPLVFFGKAGLAQSNESCDFLKGLGANERVNCGYLQVPENHSIPEGRKLNIAYVILKARNSSTNNEPLIFFMGGPGGEMLSPGFIEMWLNTPIIENRDVILFDQRGTNYSAELPDIGLSLFNILAADANVASEQAMFIDSLSLYKEICQKQGIDLGSFNSFENAKDVGLLMKHFAYKKYNLFGSSYGTRLARIVMEMYPEMVNSVILDSPSPLEGDFLLSRLHGYTKALQRVIDNCELNVECKGKYPNLEHDYLIAIEEFKSNPLKIQFNGGKKFYVNSQDAIYLLRRRLYSRDALQSVPIFIEGLANRDTVIIKSVVEAERNIYFEKVNHSMFLSVENYSQFNPDLTTEKIDSVYKKLSLLPERLGYFNSLYVAGQTWHNNRLTNNEKKFLRSEIPTLILVNRFDPATPPENGLILKKDLTNSTLLVLNKGGHGALDGSECMWKLLTNFLEHNIITESETSCLNLF